MLFIYYIFILFDIYYKKLTKKKVAELIEWLDNGSHCMEDKSVYEAKIKELEALVHLFVCIRYRLNCHLLKKTEFLEINTCAH